MVRTESRSQEIEKCHRHGHRPSDGSCGTKGTGGGGGGGGGWEGPGIVDKDGI